MEEGEHSKERLEWEKCLSLSWDKALIKSLPLDSRTLLWRTLWSYFTMISLPFLLPELWRIFIRFSMWEPGGIPGSKTHGSVGIPLKLLHMIVTSFLLADSLFYFLSWSKLSCWRFPSGKALKVTSSPQGTESYQQSSEWAQRLILPQLKFQTRSHTLGQQPNCWL